MVSSCSVFSHPNLLDYQKTFDDILVLAEERGSYGDLGQLPSSFSTRTVVWSVCVIMIFKILTKSKAVHSLVSEVIC